METGYRMLRSKEVINMNDGRRLGRVTDVIFTYPEGNVLGIVVPGVQGFHFSKEEQFIDLRNIVKIGDDVVLVEVKAGIKPSKPMHDFFPPKPPCPSSERKGCDASE